MSAPFLLRLYVTGTTPGSVRAIRRARRLCEAHLEERYELQVIDIYQRPQRAIDDQIVATPTLIRVRPAPRQRYIGDLSRSEPFLADLDSYTPGSDDD